MLKAIDVLAAARAEAQVVQAWLVLVVAGVRVLRHKARAAPQCNAKSKRMGGGARLQRCGVFVFAECMVLVAERLRVSETGIIGTAPGPRKPWRFGS
jgi:hypothetical protein